MPLYEYRCQPCRTTFELLRPMGRSDEPASCPAGHPAAARVVSLIAARAWDRAGATALLTTGSGGGCGSCAGGGCACGSS